jgi:hypothetical protein
MLVFFLSNGMLKQNKPILYIELRSKILRIALQLWVYLLEKFSKKV